jgi:hypothetical protein
MNTLSKLIALHALSCAALVVAGTGCAVRYATEPAYPVHHPVVAHHRHHRTARPRWHAERSVRVRHHPGRVGSASHRTYVPARPVPVDRGR